MHIYKLKSKCVLALGFPGGSNDEESPSMQELQVQSLGQEDPLVKEMATHSSILTWRIPWTEEPGGQQSTGSQRVGHDLATKHGLLEYLKLSLNSSWKLWYFITSAASFSERCCLGKKV